MSPKKVGLVLLLVAPWSRSCSRRGSTTARSSTSACCPRGGSARGPGPRARRRAAHGGLHGDRRLAERLALTGPFHGRPRGVRGPVRGQGLARDRRVRGPADGVRPHRRPARGPALGHGRRLDVGRCPRGHGGWVAFGGLWTALIGGVLTRGMRLPGPQAVPGVRRRTSRSRSRSSRVWRPTSRWAGSTPRTRGGCCSRCS
ncbi:hypothetical protein NKG05_13425 [Oerskovia sp. M15]